MKRWVIYIILLFSCLRAFAQPHTGTLEGIVTDAKTGDPLLGVNIVLHGTIRGTVTDIHGKFLLI